MVDNDRCGCTPDDPHRLRRQPHAESVDVGEGVTAEDHRRWPHARELFLSCARCGASGSALVDDASVLWSVLPLRVDAGSIEHDCQKPSSLARSTGWSNPVAERLAVDMTVLRYFSDDGRLATWNPNLQSTIDGEVQRDRESIERYLTVQDRHGNRRPVVMSGGAPSVFPGALVRVVGAFLRALDDEESDRRRWNPPASELRRQIGALADEFRAATPEGQQPGDPPTLEQLAILRRRPLAPLTAGAAAFHRDEGREERQSAGRSVDEAFYAGTEPDHHNRPTDPLAPPPDPIAFGGHNEGPGHTADSADLRRLIDTLPTEARVALRMKLDGFKGRDIAEHLGVPEFRAYELVRRGVAQVAAEVEREQRILDAA